MQFINNLNKGDINLMHKKGLVTLFLTTCLVFMLATSALAADFSDVKGHWAEKQIKEWADKGLAGGYSDGSFKPNGKVTRAEFVALVNRAFDIQGKNSSNAFSDVAPEKWYSGDVSAAVAAGYTAGYDNGTFRPGKNISRQEVASILARLLKLEPAAENIAAFKDVAKIPQWSRGSIGAAVANGLMGGFPDNSFRAQRGITRAEAVVSLDRALKQGSEALSRGPEIGPAIETAIKGKVTFNGKAVQDAAVRIFKAGSFEALAKIETGNKGDYNLKLDPGSYDLTAGTNEQLAYKSNIKVPENEVVAVDFYLRNAAVVKGVLEDKDGEAVANALVYFTTNPTFLTNTNDKGEYKIPVLPDRNYTVRASNPDEGNDLPEVIASELQIGSAGQQNMEPLNVSFSIGGNTPGGGGVVGGGGPVDLPPVVNSVSFMVNNTLDTVTGDNNEFSVDLSGYSDSDVFTSITVNASEDAKKAEVTLLGITKTMTFNEGSASSTVKELLELGNEGSGISMKGLRTIWKLVEKEAISITVIDEAGNDTTVSVDLIL